MNNSSQKPYHIYKIFFEYSNRIQTHNCETGKYNGPLIPNNIGTYNLELLLKLINNPTWSNG